MILILIILYLSRSFIHAAPACLLDSNSTVPHLAESATQLSSADHQRSIWDILWSCLATIFACSWVSVHPNIPPPNEKWWMASLRRLELMMWAILAPELIILWAMRQWLGARSLAEKYQDQGWTKTHGYFLQMGGFALFKGAQFQGVLYAQTISGANPDLQISKLTPENFPMTTEEGIQDCSKGDGLSKALAIGQTLWFVMQCIARHIEGLYITELELATAAFAVLNGVMYFLWWNKPLAVQCPVPIQLLGTPGTGSQPPNVATSQTGMTSSGITLSTIPSRILHRPAEIWGAEKCVQPGSTFFASTSREQDNSAKKWASVAAIIFGGIHCVGWLFTSLSHAELTIWQVCSIVITTIPLVTLALALLRATGQKGNIIRNTFCVFSAISIPLYMIARVLLLAEAFATLGHLPPEAYKVVRWVTFIPHI